MPAATDVPTRDRVLYASAELFRRQGYAGTGLKQIAGHAAAPFGSIYHFFPGGKEQLAEEVLRTGGAFFLALYEAIVPPAESFEQGIAAFFAGAAQTLETTDYADACPIATVAGEIASTHDGLRAATADVFESWLAALSRDLGGDRERAIALLALLEGAFLLCRSLRSTEPMEAARLAALELLKEPAS